MLTIKTFRKATGKLSINKFTQGDIKMANKITIENLSVSQCLFDFIEQEVLPGISISSSQFWGKFSTIIDELSPQNRTLLATRDAMQTSIDGYHQSNKPYEFSHYKNFLKNINYLEPVVKDFIINTHGVDNELALMAGPQLVVPIMNARFALNAVNARWGSLYDALYGTDAISSEEGAQPGTQYNPIRGKKVVAFAKEYLDKILPLKVGSHSQVVRYQLADNLVITLNGGQKTSLKKPNTFIGYTGQLNRPSSLMFKHNGLHLALVFDDSSAIGQQDISGLSDITLESALTTIMDCEDSVAAVDGEDKVIAYRNWLGLMTGKLSATLNKKGKSITRTMHDDIKLTTLNGDELTLKGRSLMFVRNVGHLMTNNAIIDSQGNEVPEGIIDAMVTSLIALHDLHGKQTLKNSNTGSIYIVKPKMHGSDEVTFANTLFSRVEDALTLPKNTIKMGIMDEERRTSINLKNCIYAAKDRVVFINTGFLDRTGDEIHTSMLAGAMARKADIKLTPWISAYENNNVDVGLACGFSQKAQIGKGMWPIPDQMSNMLATKINHVEAGANTAWVPSPTAATLHALHYHRVNVFNLQKQLSLRVPANIDDILTIPLAPDTDWNGNEIEQEIDNNCQGILGYVVRWIDHGVGCSKVPDINNVGLMEDRATLRISSQHIANWLTHNICTTEQVQASLQKMARIVDKQNEGDPSYQAMSDNFSNSIAFNAAAALIFKGTKQPNGYTEPLLHQYRLEKKRQNKR
jgi:malate synthase